MFKKSFILVSCLFFISCASNKPIWDGPRQPDIVVSFSEKPTERKQYLGDFIVEEVGSDLSQVRQKAIAKVTEELRKAGGNYLYVASMGSQEVSAGWFKSPKAMLEKKVRIEAQGYLVK